MNNTRKMSIPAVGPGTINPTVEHTRFLDAVKQNLDVITGRASGVAELVPLPASANLAQVVAQLNAIAARLNASGGES